jgi:IS30 family transposase
LQKLNATAKEAEMGQDNHSTGRRKWKQISERERYKIEALAKAKMRPKEIAAALGWDRRTIERELARGTAIQRDSQWRDKGIYLADAGQRDAAEKAGNKGRGLKIGHDHRLARYLGQKIGEGKYSPDAAIGEIKAKGLKFDVTLCTKTVYNMIDRGDFLNISNKDLPAKKRGKKRKHRKARSVALKNLTGKSIEERPEAVGLREEAGHWEMDLVVGNTKACLLVMTERMSRRELVFKIPDKKQDSVIKAIDRLERKYGSGFSQIFKSITMDNGSEFLDSKRLEASCVKPGLSRTACYYAHPYSSWERGGNENANKLIRRFVPKGSDIGKLRNKDVKRIEQWMNNYPRRMFGYKTANDVYDNAAQAQMGKYGGQLNLQSSNIG